LPVLSDAAHLALQAIHLGAGHRFQKLILLRDIARAGWFPERGEVVSDLGAAPALRTIQQVIQHLGQPVRESGATRIERAVARRLAMTDPQQWDEFAPTTENGMAVLVGARGRVAPQLALRIGTNVLRRRSAHLAARTPA
jgi:hypothetical protein